jgi:hypothetical protein
VSTSYRFAPPEALPKVDGVNRFVWDLRYAAPPALPVKLDPRVQASEADLREQLDLDQKIGRGMATSFEGYYQVADLRAALTDRKKTVTVKTAAEPLEKNIDAIDQGKRTSPGFGPVNRDLTRLATSVQSGDTRPSEPVRTAVEEKCRALSDDLAK